MRRTLIIICLLLLAPAAQGQWLEEVIYLPDSFPRDIERQVTAGGAALESVSGPTEICPHVHSTGELGTAIKEQSLILELDRGLVVITGCAHPGIVHIVREAGAQRRRDVHLAMGGFHLTGTSSARISSIVEEIRAEGVQTAILFTGQDNLPAQKAYTALGFRHIGAYRLLMLREPLEGR